MRRFAQDFYPNWEADLGVKKLCLAVVDHIGRSRRHNPWNLESMTYAHGLRLLVDLTMEHNRLNVVPQFELRVYNKDIEDDEHRWRLSCDSQSVRGNQSKLRPPDSTASNPPRGLGEPTCKAIPDFAVYFSPFQLQWMGTASGLKGLEFPYDDIHFYKRFGIPVIVEFKRRHPRPEPLKTILKTEKDVCGVNLKLTEARAQLEQYAAFVFSHAWEDQDVVLLMAVSGEHWQYRLCTKGDVMKLRDAVEFVKSCLNPQKVKVEENEEDEEDEEYGDDNDGDESDEYIPEGSNDGGSEYAPDPEYAPNPEELEKEVMNLRSDFNEDSSIDGTRRVRLPLLTDNTYSLSQADVTEGASRSSTPDEGVYELDEGILPSEVDINEEFIGTLNAWSGILRFGTGSSNQRLWRITEYLHRIAVSPGDKMMKLHIGSNQTIKDDEIFKLDVTRIKDLAKRDMQDPASPSIKRGLKRPRTE